MWKHNDSSTFLEEMSEDEKNKAMSSARKRGPQLTEKRRKGEENIRELPKMKT